MVKDPKFYDILQVSSTANDLELKKAYRRAAIQLHPDKNPNDPNAHERFQELGEAYQILSNEKLRKKYDKFGPDMLKNNGDIDSEDDVFSTAFGGQAFEDWIGEFTFIKNLMEKNEILWDPDEVENEADPNKEATNKNQSSEMSSRPSNVSESEESSSNIPARPSYSTPSANVPNRLALKEKSEEESQAEASSVTKADKDRLAKEKRDAKLKALAALNEEQKKRRLERINALTQKLVDRVSIWTETDKNADVTEAFKNKIQLEVESLKMESFGVELLHAVGLIYSQKGTSFLRSQKFFGVTGFFSRAKDKVNSGKELINTLVVAYDTSKALAELAQEKREVLEAQKENGGKLTFEQQVKFQEKEGGTILGAILEANLFEIKSVLREVCDKMLYDKNVKLGKRVERAKALSVIGELCQRAERSEEEQNDFQAFERLVRETAQKRREAKKANSSHKTEGEKAEITSIHSPKTRASEE